MFASPGHDLLKCLLLKHAWHQPGMQTLATFKGADLHTQPRLHVAVATETLWSHIKLLLFIQGGSNMTGTDLCVNKPQCAAAVRP